jgi:N-acetylmuramoyl-L-alanine amidase
MSDLIQPTDLTSKDSRNGFSRRSFLSGLAGLGAASVLRPSDAGAAPTKTVKEFNWRPISHENRDYIRMKDVKSFYQFQRYERDGRHLWLRTNTLMLKATQDSDDLFMNNVKFCMSYPAIARESDLLISRMDLAKLVEPVLRPKFIEKPIVFDTVVLDAGHGGQDTGTRGVLGWEKDYALDTTLRLKKLLEAKGFKIRMTRSTDVFIEKQDRTKIANAIPTSIFVSVHYNSGGSRGNSASGIETYALSPHGAASTDKGSSTSDLQEFSGNDRDSENIALATAVHAMVLFKVKCQDRGIRRARWSVLTGLERPGILFEGGFITNQEEGSRVHTSTYRDQLADAMCQGILRYRQVLLSRRGTR